MMFIIIGDRERRVAHYFTVHQSPPVQTLCGLVFPKIYDPLNNEPTCEACKRAARKLHRRGMRRRGSGL